METEKRGRTRVKTSPGPLLTQFRTPLFHAPLHDISASIFGVTVNSPATLDITAHFLQPLVLLRFGLRPAMSFALPTLIIIDHNSLIFAIRPLPKSPTALVSSQHLPLSPTRLVAASCHCPQLSPRSLLPLSTTRLIAASLATVHICLSFLGAASTVPHSSHRSPLPLSTLLFTLLSSLCSLQPPWPLSTLLSTLRSSQPPRLLSTL